MEGWGRSAKQFTDWPKNPSKNVSLGYIQVSRNRPKRQPELSAQVRNLAGLMNLQVAGRAKSDLKNKANSKHLDRSKTTYSDRWHTGS